MQLSAARTNRGASAVACENNQLDSKWPGEVYGVRNKMTPEAAKKRSNQQMVSRSLWNNAKRNRKYPDMKVGDDVRVMIKRKEEHNKSVSS